MELLSNIKLAFPQTQFLKHSKQKIKDFYSSAVMHFVKYHQGQEGTQSHG